MNVARLPAILSLTGLLLCNFALAQQQPTPEERTVRFSSEVLPILADACFTCHGFDAETREAGLRLDQRDAALAILSPDDPEASELLLRIDSDDPDMVMPPPDSGKELNEQQRKTLHQWIAEGADYERHWSFEPIRNPEPPAVDGNLEQSDRHDAQHPIDRFVQAKLHDAGLTASAEAAPATLIRRVSLDLTGIPPTPQQIDAFTRAYGVDPDSAYRQLVDRLLSSPHYGQRWARWWLDQARYADSNGYSIDSPRSIWKFRDWVIHALNDDMPFDQFTIEQLAGDLLPDATVEQQIATGFHRNTQINQEGGIDREQYRIDSIFDRVATTGTVWLGLTVGCAQCHDHKFDPIAQKEFYQLFAFLNNQDEPSIRVYDPDIDVAQVTARRGEAKAALDSILDSATKKLSDWESKLDETAKQELSSAAQKALKAPPEKRRFEQKLALYEASPIERDADFNRYKQTWQANQRVLDEAPTTMVLRERSEPRETHVLIKGDFTRPAEEVTPGTPAVLHPLPEPSATTATSSPEDQSLNRLDLARWIVSPDNPLTARVIVNRIWQQYFGIGIVSTENDFGLVGARPTHPDLLDWLASDFQRHGWSMKRMHRQIVMSHAYRQSSRQRDELQAVDPQNRLLGRQRRLRLDAEIVRDVALTASGLLADIQGGPPVYPPIPDGVMSQGQVQRSWNASEGADRYRRGLYTFIYRATPPPSLTVFDAPDGFSSCTRRTRSNTPLQSLTLMNDTGFFEFAKSLEKIIQQDGLAVAFRRCTGRRPDDEELAVLEKLDSLTAARVMLNLDETITRE